MIFTFTLRDENNSRLDLISDLPPTAKALRQVSREVCAESLAVYYSTNSFTLDIDCAYLGFGHDSYSIHEWISVFGGFAVHHLRSIRIYMISNDPHKSETVAIDLTDSVHPVTWYKNITSLR